MEIPNILHICTVVKSSTGQLILEEVKDKNAEYQIIEWDLELYEQLIKKHYPQLENIYFAFEYDIQKAFLGRLAALHKYGGIFLSNSMYPIKPIKLFEQSLEEFYQQSFVHSRCPKAVFFERWPFDFEDECRIGNQVIVSTAGSTFLSFLLSEIINSTEILFSDNEKFSFSLQGISEQCEIIDRSCGEKFIHDAIKKYQYDTNFYDVAVLPSFIVNPCISSSKLDHNEHLVFSGIVNEEDRLKASKDWEPINQGMINNNQLPNSFMIYSQPDRNVKQSISTKVAVIAWQFPNRANTFVMNEIIQMHRKGVDLTIYSMSHPTAECKIIYEDELKEIGHKIICVPQNKLINHQKIREDRIAFFQNEFRLNLDLCKTIDPTSESFNQQEQECVQNSHGFLELFIKDIKSRGIEKIYAPFANGDAEIAMMLSHNTGIPYYFTAHAYDLFSSYHYSRMKAKTASHCFTISEYNKNYMVSELGMDPEKITVRRINFLAPNPTEVKQKKLSAPYILSAGRFDEMKGFEYSIKAFAEFHEQYPEVNYVIVGCGDLEKTIKDLIKSLNLENHVHLVGHVKNHEVLEFAKGAEFSILSSIELANKDKEGVPTCFVESMSLGTPCIGTNYSGTPELIDHGVNGMLTKEKNVRDISDKMIQLYNMLRNDEEQRISKSCKLKIEKMFNNEENINLLLEHLK